MNEDGKMELAVIDTNTLACLGLELILNKVVPDAVIRIFHDFGSFMDDTPDMYHYYFVSSEQYVLYNFFFLPRKERTIIMMHGTFNHSIPRGNNILNVDRPEKKLTNDVKRYFMMDDDKKMLSTRDDNDLSPREIDVLVLVCKGLLNKEIAEKLNISLTTVITHRKNITQKLGIKSVSGLTLYAIMNGYITPDKI